MLSGREERSELLECLAGFIRFCRQGLKEEVASQIELLVTVLLQHALGVPHPQYLHSPLVLAADGEKLSKQHGAPALDLSDPLAALQQAAQALGLPPAPDTKLTTALAFWVSAWGNTYNLPRD